MPGSNSIATLVSKSQRLLAAIAQNTEQLPATEARRAQLEQALTTFQDLLVRRDTLKADKQVLSRQLLEAGQTLVDSLIDLKALLKSVLGSRSEKLSEFQVKPRRKVLVSERPSRKAAAAKRAARQPADSPPANAVPTTTQAP